jgi:hypothetical protein
MWILHRVRGGGGMESYRTLSVAKEQGKKLLPSVRWERV